MRKAAFVSVWLFLAVCCQGRVITVDDDGPANFDNIQAAIDDANGGDEIIVADGTYTGPGNRDIEFLGKAITVRSENGPGNCIIDCLGGDTDRHRGFVFKGGEDANSILNGFTITHGYIGRGGGIYCRYSSPRIVSCLISDNSATDYGGGIHCYESSPMITRCNITGNSGVSDGTTPGHGGGISCYGSGPTIVNCTIIDNSAVTGGGIYCYNDSGLTITNSIISANLAQVNGGGIACYGLDSALIITNCIISDNTTYGFGGGITCDDGSSLTITDCTISANSAGGGGGIVCFRYSSLTINNCKISANIAEHSGGIVCYMCISSEIDNSIITGNSADNGGGGISCFGRGPIVITNCTITGNATGAYGGGISCYGSNPVITNCILWGDTAEMDGNQIALYISDYPSAPTVSYSDVEGGLATVYIDPNCSVIWGSGNIDVDPCFVEAGYWDVNGIWVEGDYRLLAGSPCIDTGDPNYIPEPNETDLDGNPRVSGDAIDMGAYEYEPPVEAEVEIKPETVNLGSRGKWIRCYISLGEDCDVGEIEAESVLLEYEIEAESVQMDQQRQVALAKFRRAEVQGVLETGEVEITISGELTDGTVFEGADIIRVIDRGGKKKVGVPVKIKRGR